MLLARLPSNDSVIPGVWMSVDHDMNPAAGLMILAREVQKSEELSRELAETMVALGTDAGVHTVALLTDMSTPLGRTAGNGVEEDTLTPNNVRLVRQSDGQVIPGIAGTTGAPLTRAR